ncbi:peptide deformylase, partial [Streptomyces sp. NPDC059616]|uniref:peptide deformylase n=1 Tax=Streptomyces sp. NPDC059616 TaxID=3346886 RepID=UPI0036AD6C98
LPARAGAPRPPPAAPAPPPCSGGAERPPPPPHGEPVRITGTGFFARCLQHECDHLEGTVYTDRLTGLRRRRAMRAARRAPWARTGEAAS